jgi:hypothetical protein
MESSTLSVPFLPLLGLLTLCLVGGVFGIAATMVAARFGRARLVPLWIAASVALGSLGAARVVAFQRSLGRGPDHVSGPGTFALLIVALSLTLSIPTFAVSRRAQRSPAAASYARVAFAATGWTFLGLLLMSLVALILDVANVPFIPFR